MQNPETGSLQSIFSLGYDYKLTTSTVKATINSAGIVRCVAEERFSALGFKVCGEADLMNDVCRLGFATTFEF